MPRVAQNAMESSNASFPAAREETTSLDILNNQLCATFRDADTPDTARGMRENFERVAQ
jgi:hypothetical protein